MKCRSWEKPLTEKDEEEFGKGLEKGVDGKFSIDSLRELLLRYIESK